MIRPFIDAAGVLRPTPMELYAAARADEEFGPLDAEQPPEGGRSLATEATPSPTDIATPVLDKHTQMRAQ